MMMLNNGCNSGRKMPEKSWRLEISKMQTRKHVTEIRPSTSGNVDGGCSVTGVERASMNAAIACSSNAATGNPFTALNIRL